MASRYELKYLLPHRVAIRVREFVSQYLELDEFGAGKVNNAYPVHSLYLDSDDWKLYWRTVNGDKNRFKLRIRYYDDSPDSPVFWEVKRKLKDVILKQRCAIKRCHASRVIHGQLPARSEMFWPDNPKDLKAIQEFFGLQFGIGAVPKLHIAYEREAYVHPHKSEFRVTFDRHVRAVPRLDGKLTTQMRNPMICTGTADDPEDVVILELKFIERFPSWYRDLVTTFNLMQTGAAKYCDGMTMFAGRELGTKDVVRTLVM